MIEEPPTWRHRLGLTVGRVVRRWLVRGYGWGTLRNGIAIGLDQHPTPLPHRCPGAGVTSLEWLRAQLRLMHAQVMSLPGTPETRPKLHALRGYVGDQVTAALRALEDHQRATTTAGTARWYCTGEHSPLGTGWPCSVVQLIAAPFANQPDFPQELR